MSISLESNAPSDFDFVIGNWSVKHCKLRDRLTGCDEWAEFDGLSSTQKILGGFGNIEDNHLFQPEASLRAVALRSYNSETGQWSIWWLDGRFPVSLDAPLVGRFVDGVGVFLVDDMLNGRPIKVRFTWTVPVTGSRHSQLTEERLGRRTGQWCSLARVRRIAPSS